MRKVIMVAKLVVFCFIANVMCGCKVYFLKFMKVDRSSEMVFTALWPFNVGVLMDILQKILYHIL
jgi:hypothetical protein